MARMTEVQKLERKLKKAKADAAWKRRKAAERAAKVPVTQEEMNKIFSRQLATYTRLSKLKHTSKKHRRQLIRDRKVMPDVREAYDEIVEHVLNGGRVFVYTSRIHEPWHPEQKRHRSPYLFELVAIARWKFPSHTPAFRVRHRRAENEEALSGCYLDEPSWLIGWLTEPGAEYELR